MKAMKASTASAEEIVEKETMASLARAMSLASEAEEAMLRKECKGEEEFELSLEADREAEKLLLEGAKEKGLVPSGEVAVSKRPFREGEQGEASKKGKSQGPSGGMRAAQLSMNAKGKGVAVLARESTVSKVRGGGQSLRRVKEAEEEGWQLVRGRARRSGRDPESSISGALHSRRALPTHVQRGCFRYLGRGHLARDCHDPPHCWTCKKLGHRSFVCRSFPRVVPSLSGQVRKAGGFLPLSSPSQVEVEWSSEILDRVCSMGKSVVVS
ncbi:hypothetical protein QJS10_CPB17g00366 [Acorus calamus]|uniref:CCHC-type domain-containing protein n=1 Tax=Acorus calamus TaxID=4465 RepID=A0AAV9CRG6_ACOCL|nr:hypothetical protein QJS10_CPB17g00366 [Acorus calamus]